MYPLTTVPLYEEQQSPEQLRRGTERQLKATPWLWIVEMDYKAWRTKDDRDEMEWWRYYVSAVNEADARTKVEHYVASNSPYYSAKIRRIWRTEALIW